MKKIKLLKLKILQENILTKEDKKQILGGSSQGTCYIVCKSHPGRQQANDCSGTDIYHICGEQGAICCGCWGNCY